MHLLNEKRISVIEESLPQEYLDYVLRKDKNNQILSVSFNGIVMLLEYQQGRIKEALKQYVKNPRTYNQFTGNKREFLSRSVGNYKPLHIIVKIKDDTVNTFILPNTIGGKYKKDVMLADNTKILLTYTSPEKSGMFENELGRPEKKKYVTHYKGEVNNVFTDYLEDIFTNENSSSYNVFNI